MTEAQPIFQDEVAKLNEIRQSIVKKVQEAVGGQMPPSVSNATAVMLQHLDTGYLWLTQVEQFVHMNSAANVEKVAGEAIAKGDVTLMDGGK